MVEKIRNEEGLPLRLCGSNSSYSCLIATSRQDSGEQVGASVSEQVAAMLRSCAREPQTKSALLAAAGLANVYLNYKRHIQPLLATGLLEMTHPEKPNSRLQKYRITEKGREIIDE